MANNNNRVLLGLVFLYLIVNFIECGRSGGSRGSGSHSRGSSWGRSWGSSSHSYKPSSSSSGHTYPSSSSGLSGWSSSGSHSYPSSSSGLSGSGSGSHGYPSSSSGLSGSGSHGYPSSSSGLSGTSYGNYRPSNSYNTNSGYGHNSYGYGVNNYEHSSYNIPHYYQAPQYVYVQEYRNSGSRYSDLLTGLALYNMGRSHSDYDHHYYYDDYYRKRYYGSSSTHTYGSSDGQKDVAVCTLQIKENGKLEELKVPCEIVSTFTEGSSKVTVNKTVCTTNSTMVNNTLPTNASSVSSTISPNITMVNTTTCTSTVNATDPMKVKGEPVDPRKTNMECAVDIRTKDTHLRNKVDCEMLLKYAKMPEPSKTVGILPERSKLKSLLANPPWWMSMFIAV